MFTVQDSVHFFRFYLVLLLAVLRGNSFIEVIHIQHYEDSENHQLTIRKSWRIGAISAYELQ